MGHKRARGHKRDRGDKRDRGYKRDGGMGGTLGNKRDRNIRA